MISASPNIFIVDDDSSFGRSLVRLLNVRGLNAEYFESARTFMDSVPPNQTGLAILDIHMPEVDGFALLDKMHEMNYDMPVIFVTGQAQADDRNLAFQKGARGFLLKPFSEESLLELLHLGTDI